MRKSFWQSKKWWMSVLAASVPVANSAFGWDLDPVTVGAAVLPLIAYVIGEAWTDTVR